MRYVQTHLLLLCFVWIAATISGCATVARGADTNFTIKSKQDGVSVLLDLETKDSRSAVDWRARRDALRGEVSVPEFLYARCDALPCDLTIPKARVFSVLAYKDGYVPRRYQIAHVHKDDFATLSNAAAIGATATTVGSFGILASGIPFYGASSISPAVVSVAAPAFALAFPATIFLLGSNEVDKENKANYEFFPNPLLIELTPLGPDDPKVTSDQIAHAFHQQRIAASLDPVKSDMCYIGDERMGCWRARKLKEDRARRARY